SFIKHQLEEGHQAFIVYPLVEASDDSESRSAVEAFDELSTTIFRHYRCGLMHGRLKPSEKDEVMAAFAHGEIQVLISTSVIEVGIDVPNATAILIEGANRFGLAQLHQFRGRVGRGEHQSFCLLISDSDNPESVERLRRFETLSDGFALAELDWQLRGPGDLLGTRQAGYGAVRFDQSMDVQLVELAQKESRAIYAEDPLLTMPEHQLLARRVRLLQERRTDLS
ncbi:partial ATP-dependent DNA helicase RecG, partial [Anaerolineae bacterium]